MRVAVRKLQIEDSAKLQMLVAENIDAIEPGLVVLDSRLLLGHATIDVVGVDTNGALVLIATGLTANEEMLLRAVEAYSWSREYPESLERLYPSCVISDERPPRLVFVVERMPDAFHRKIKQLGFPDVDCVEFRLLDVEGAPAVYFESILRLRRPVATPAVPPPAESPAPAAAGSENVIAMNGPVAARATSLKLQKLLNQAAVESAHGAPRAVERPLTAPREPAPVVSMVSRQAAAAARVERSRPEPVSLRDVAPAIAAAIVLAPEPSVEPLALIEAAPIVDAAPAIVHEPEPIVVPGPVIVMPEPMIATPEPVVVVPAPVIVTPETIVVPKATEPDADLVAQIQEALAAIDHKHTMPAPEPSDEPVIVVEPTLELVAAPELVTAPAPVAVAEPLAAIEEVVAPEPVLELEPKLELVTEPVLATEPELELVVEADPLVAALAPESAPSEPMLIPSLAVAATSVPSLDGERVSLRSLPELSLRPTAPVTMPRPAPIPTPAPSAPVVAEPAAAKPAAEEPRVSFKDLAAALLGSAPVQSAPERSVTPKRVDAAVAVAEPAEPVVETPQALDEGVAKAAAETEPVVIEPVSPAMAHAVAELEPALTVEALIKSTLAEAGAAPAAPAVQTPAAETAKPAAALPLEFAGLQFPKDGVMTRQWMEFLSQMSTTK